MDEEVLVLLKIVKIPDPALQAHKWVEWLTQASVQERVVHVDQCIHRCLQGNEDARDILNPVVLAKAILEILSPETKKEIHDQAVALNLLFVAALFSDLHPHMPYPNVQDIPIIDVRQFIPTQDEQKKDPITLGERRTLAKSPYNMVIEKLLMDPDPKVTENLLDNSMMNEKWVLKLASKRPMLAETLQTLATHPRWGRNKRVRFALSMNPYTPPAYSIFNLFTLPHTELAIVAQAEGLHDVVQKVAQEIIRKK